MNVINIQKKSRETSTFYFITLYTNLPNEDRILHKLVACSVNARCKDQKGYRKYLPEMKTDCVWTKKKCGLNSYTMHHARIVLNYIIKYVIVRLEI